MDIDFKNNFRKLVESLKRHQRAELCDEADDNIIEKLYTDPFEGDSILNAMLNDQMTLLIGRKGIGKSTIINRFQHEIRKSTDKISLYVDVRTLYSKSIDDNSVNYVDNAFTFEEQKKLSVYSKFIERIILEIEQEINKSIFDKNLFDRLKNALSSKRSITIDNFKEELRTIFENAIKGSNIDISKITISSINNSEAEENMAGISSHMEISTIKQHVGFKTEESNKTSCIKGNNYSSILKRDYNIIKFIESIKKLLSSIGIKKVFICLDDCSELDKESLEMLISTIVAPLHNNSEGFFRFKIALYPERNILPEIDRTKIDTCNLDYYSLYKSSGIDKVEEFATSFVSRLIKQRIKYYFNTSNESDVESSLFDIKQLSIEGYYRLIFNICSCNPRNIGKLLFYASRRSLDQGKKINKSILQEAAEEQYGNDIEFVLSKDEFLQYRSYDEQLTRIQLKSLLNLIIEKAKENKRQIGSSEALIFKKYNTNNAPSHFFYVNKDDYEKLLNTLELNFFINRISEQKDKGSYEGQKLVTNEVVVYTINYGLCKKENIIYEDVNDRKYKIERVFDLNKKVSEWVNGSLIVKCNKCNHTFDYSEWDMIQNFDCMCQHCKEKKACELISLMNSITQQHKDTTRINSNVLKNIQMRILYCMKLERDLTSKQIASEIDVSRETINAYLRKDRKLIEEGYVNKESDTGTSLYNITEKGLETLQG